MIGRGGRKFLCFEAISSSGFKCGTIRIKVSAREGEKGACFERLRFVAEAEFRSKSRRGKGIEFERTMNFCLALDLWNESVSESLCFSLNQFVDDFLCTARYSSTQEKKIL